MATNRTSIVSDRLIQKFQSIEKTRKRMDRLYSEGVIFRKDIEHVYEGMFLKAVTSFESYLEEIFMGILHNKYALPTRRKLNKVQFNSKKIASDIVLNGQSYVDWLPFEKLEKRAKIYFENGEPFTILDPSDKSLLTQVMSIRNAIAHKSSFSDEKFRRQVLSSNAGVPDEHKSPAGFLRYIYRTSPDQTKFENYILELVSIASKVSSYS